MTNLSSTSGIAKMDQARKLMEKGHHRESLLLALEVLLEELNNLRESLVALQLVTHLELETEAPAGKEPPEPDHFWLPPVKRVRTLH